MDLTARKSKNKNQKTDINETEKEIKADIREEKPAEDTLTDNKKKDKKTPEEKKKSPPEFAAEQLRHLGAYVCYIIKTVFEKIFTVLGLIAGFLWKHTIDVRNAIVSFFKFLGLTIASPFLKFATEYKRMKRKMSIENTNNGKAASIKVFFVFFARFVFGKRGLAITVFNYAAPIVSLVFLFNVVTYATSINYAVKLYVNDHFIGYIDNEQVFTDAEIIMRQRIDYYGSSATVVVTPSYSIEKIGYSETLNRYQVADIMLQHSGVSVEYAYGFSVNGKFYGAVLDNSSIKKTLDDLLNVYREQYPDAEVAFVDDVQYTKAGLYLTESIVDPQEIIDEITQLVTVAHYYSVVYGDSHIGIANKLDMTRDEIEALNPGFNDNDLHVDDQIKINADEPYLSVAVTQVEQYDTNVDFDVEYYEDANLYTGLTSITTAGVYGVDHVTAKVSYVNGYETKRVVIKSVRVSDPETQLVARGTKPKPIGSISTETAEFGKFIMPLYGGRVSEWGWWDGGYYGHSGIDLVSYYGAPIYAGMTGTVTFSGWKGGYGWCIMIDHGGGVTTLYGHMCELYASVGDIVSQGQCIGAMGATGKVTGPHLHFEVRINGACTNPRYYLNL